MIASVASKLAVAAGLFVLSVTASAVTLDYMVGDGDGFGGTQGSVSVPGSSFSVFASPSIPPGSYSGAAATDVTTVFPWNPYVFEFTFSWDTTGLASISSAIVQVQSGSVARRTDGSGFGFAEVTASNTSLSLPLGDLSSSSTGSASSSLEENVKLHSFAISSLVYPGNTGVLTLRIDGTSLTAPVDQFAFDFARLEVIGAVPEPATIALMLVGIAVVAIRRKQFSR